MHRPISEADWKLFRQLQPIALERLCERALSDVEKLIASSKKSAHERYLQLYKLLERKEEEIAQAFNDLRRSTAWFQIARIQSQGLFTEEEFERFSPETHQAVKVLMGG